LAWQGEGIDIEAVAQFYRDMAPKGESPQTYEDVVALDDEDCAHWKVATVENTTLLIADLEAQLKAVTNDRDELDRDILALVSARLYSSSSPSPTPGSGTSL
jgi:hypothetical protein